MNFLILKDSIYILAFLYIVYHIFCRIGEYVQSKLNQPEIEPVALIEQPHPIIIKNESNYWLLGDYEHFSNNNAYLLSNSFESKIEYILLKDVQIVNIEDNIYLTGKITGSIDETIYNKIRAGYSARYKKFFIKSTGEEIKSSEYAEIKKEKLYIYRIK